MKSLGFNSGCLLVAGYNAFHDSGFLGISSDLVMSTKTLVVAAFLGFVPVAFCQTTTVTPRPFGGGATIYTPGQPTTTVTPRPFGGGATIYTPGQPTTTVTPRPFGGGATIYTPGQPSSQGNSRQPANAALLYSAGQLSVQGSAKHSGLSK